jgi:LPS sulfotransferase NodH
MSNEIALNKYKNSKLDDLIFKINNLLAPVEEESIEKLDSQISDNYPTLFLIGTPRSGSTLFMQWIASTGAFAYPSNFMSRFNRSPYISALIYEMVTNTDYQYRDEFADISHNIDFNSSIGKTSGFMSPHEFWYFWTRFIEFPEIPFSEEEFSRNFDFNMFQKELKCLKHVFQKPFFMKAHIIVWYLESISKLCKNTIYVHLKRDPIDSIRSLIKARERWTGNLQEWFTMKPREYVTLQKMDPIHQVTGQIYFINREIENKKHFFGNEYLPVNYEEFCRDPESVFYAISEKISAFLPQFKIPQYQSVKYFQVSNPESEIDEEIRKAYGYFENKYGIIKSTM